MAACPYLAAAAAPAPAALGWCPHAISSSSNSGSSLSASSSSASLTEHVDLAHALVTSAGDAVSPSSPAGAGAATAAPTSTSSGVHQAWRLTRPTLGHDPKLTRRQLRRLGRSWSLADVAAHRFADDGWIAVDGRVYDITEHVASHPGWDSGCQVTTVLSILAHLGTDCSAEFAEIHRPYPVAWQQLRAFYIGDLTAGKSS